MNEPEENFHGAWGEDISLTTWDLIKIGSAVLVVAVAVGVSVGWLAIKLVESIGG